MSTPGLSSDSIGMVVTSDLVVRSLPEISDASTINPVALNHRDLLYVLAGPVTADGYDWYHVAPFLEFVEDTPYGPRPGWVAAGDDDEQWIAPWAGTCPQPTVESLRLRSRLLALACFGSSELVLEGRRGDCSYVVPGTVSPAWLSSWFCVLLPRGFQPQISVGFTYHQAAETLPIGGADETQIRITGHFDDPAAQTCTGIALPGEEAPVAELVILGCRASFVADEVSELPSR